MLYIRADGNPEIGTGHLMRCLSIADAVKKRGGTATFIIADELVEAMLSERGYSVVCLYSEWNNLETEIEKMVSLIETHSVDRLLIDSYFVTPEYLQRLRELTYVIYIDDLDAFHYPCDMLINYNCYADKFDYPARYPGPSLLLGCQYAPLREEFSDLPIRVPAKDVKSVLVTTGGIDPFRAAEKIVRNAKTSLDLKHLIFHVVAGRFNPNIEELTRLESEFDGVFLHWNIQKISQLMLDCDIAVSAGGSTLYELCACGTPTVTFALADNQLNGVNGFGEGYMINARDIRENEESCLSRVLDGVSQLILNHDLRCDYSEKGQNLVDGKGAVRLAEAIGSLQEKTNTHQ